MNFVQLKWFLGTKQCFRREFCEPHASFVFRFELLIREKNSHVVPNSKPLGI